MFLSVMQWLHDGKEHMYSDEHLLQKSFLLELQQINLSTLGSDKRINAFKKFSNAMLLFHLWIGDTYS